MHTLNRLSDPVFFNGVGRSTTLFCPFSTLPCDNFRKGGGSHFLLQQIIRDINYIEFI